MILSLGLTNFYLKIFLESKPGKSITLKRVKKKIRNSCRNIDDRVSEILYVFEHFCGVLSPNYFFQMWTTVPYYSTDFLLRTRVEGVDVV